MGKNTSKNPTWLSRNIRTRINQWRKTIHASNQEDETQTTSCITLCTYHKHTSKYETKIWTKFTLINSAYRFEQLVKWMKLGNWKRTNNTHCTRPDAINCTVERTLTGCLNWTTIFHLGIECSESITLISWKTLGIWLRDSPAKVMEKDEPNEQFRREYRN